MRWEARSSPEKVDDGGGKLGSGEGFGSLGARLAWGLRGKWTGGSWGLNRAKEGRGQGR